MVTRRLERKRPRLQAPLNGTWQARRVRSSLLAQYFPKLIYAAARKKP
jgi:hypothetical protein